MADRRPHRKAGRRAHWPPPLFAAAVGLVLAVQIASAGFFIIDMLSARVRIFSRPPSWELRELFEIGSAAGLVFGILFGTWIMAGALRRARTAEGRLAELSGAFHDLIKARFDAWELTPAEREVALFTLKGLSLAEIARLRRTAIGTVKAQSASVWRKAGVGGRAQFVSIFIEDLLHGAVGGCGAQEAPSQPGQAPAAARVPEAEGVTVAGRRAPDGGSAQPPEPDGTPAQARR